MRIRYCSLAWKRVLMTGPLGVGLCTAGSTSEKRHVGIPQLFASQTWSPRRVLCQSRPRSTDELEFSFIHEQDWTPAMRRISGAVDFNSVLQEGCFLVEGVAPEVIDRLSIGQKVFVQKGTVLIEEGAENSAVYAVGYGLLSVKVNGVQVASIGPGQIVGLYAMLKRTPASATVSVESDTAYVMQLRHHHFMAHLEDHPEVMARMQMILHQREMQNKAAMMINPKM
eukprot:TRINITY_DN29379_c0_g1_i1.p1 TRINITY_DN29379_c0_g1~~TRINITY_DN29379_c0_g1_i1.p1  ORF type:complete len:256 (+),score=39.85 TRINITY_DN29379_c0_g1_i1:91-768(+)